MKMTIKTTIGALRDSKDSLKTLSGLSGLGEGNAWKVSRMILAVREEMTKAQKMFEELIRDHAVKDDNREPKQVENENGIMGYELIDSEKYHKEVELANGMEVILEAEVATPVMFQFSDVTPQFFLDLSWWIVDPTKVKVIENKAE